MASTWINIVDPRNNTEVACTNSVVRVLVGVFYATCETRFLYPRVSRTLRKKTLTSAPVTSFIGSAEVAHCNHTTQFTASKGGRNPQFRQLQSKRRFISRRVVKRYDFHFSKLLLDLWFQLLAVRIPGGISTLVEI